MAVDPGLAQTRSDPRDRYDDPLLDSLVEICKLHGHSATRASLSSGLPLNNAEALILLRYAPVDKIEA